MNTDEKRSFNRGIEAALSIIDNEVLKAQDTINKAGYDTNSIEYTVLFEALIIINHKLVTAKKRVVEKDMDAYRHPSADDPLWS